MRALLLIVALAALTPGCAARIASSGELLQKTAPVAASPGAPPPPSSRLSTSAAGAVPAFVQVSNSDGTPAVKIKVIAVDSVERRYEFETNQQGEARVQIYSPHIPIWQAQTSKGDWIRLSPASVYPSDDGYGWRIALTLTQLPATAGGK